jgi:hypothetical protein
VFTRRTIDVDRERNTDANTKMVEGGRTVRPEPACEKKSGDGKTLRTISRFAPFFVALGNLPRHPWENSSFAWVTLAIVAI